MAIAYDFSSTGNANPGTSVTVAHTCTGSDLLLLVGILTNDTTDKVTGVTYNGVAMTRLAAYQAVTTNFFGFTYYLLAPATGANNIVASRSDSGLIGCMGASYTGVSQSGFPDSNASGTDAAGNFSATTTVVAANCWLWANVRSNNNVSGITAGASTTIRQNVFGSAGVMADSNAIVGTGAQSLNFVVDNGGETYWHVVSFAPAAAAGGAVRDARFLTLLGVG